MQGTERFTKILVEKAIQQIRDQRIIFYEEDSKDTCGVDPTFIARFHKAKPEDMFDGIVSARGEHLDLQVKVDTARSLTIKGVRADLVLPIIDNLRDDFNVAIAIDAYRCPTQIALRRDNNHATYRDIGIQACETSRVDTGANQTIYQIEGIHNSTCQEVAATLKKVGMHLQRTKIAFQLVYSFGYDDATLAAVITT